MVQPPPGPLKGAAPLLSDFLKARVGVLLPLNTFVADLEPLCPWRVGASCPWPGHDTQNYPTCNSRNPVSSGE